jgi:hypothetical protein
VRIKASAFVILTSAGTAFGQLDLPTINIFNYQMSARDPFISPEAPTTLLDTGGDVRGIVSGDVVKQYLDTIVSVIKDELYVGGVSIGDRPQDSLALINGVGFHSGETIPLPVDAQQLSKLAELSRTYGLPLQLAGDNAIAIVIGRITEKGVSLLVPGFKAAFYELPLESDTRPDPIKLERRPKNH